MDDLISRQAAIDIIEDFPHGDVWNVESMEEMVDRIKQLPSAQPELKKGKWIRNGWAVTCLECGYDMPYTVRRFCPNCGADMRQKGESSEND